jgi:hypothetical protein
LAESGYLFTKKVIAEYLGVSKDQVIILMKEGAPIAKNERGTYWTMKDPLDRWLNERLLKELGDGIGV